MSPGKYSKINVDHAEFSDEAVTKAIKSSGVTVPTVIVLCLITSCASVVCAYLARAPQDQPKDCASRSDIARVETQVSNLAITVSANADRAHNETSQVLIELHGLQGALSVIRTK